MTRTPAPPAAIIAATSPCSAAESERICVSNSRFSRFDITATPWSPIVPDSATRSPGRAASLERLRPGGARPTPVVEMKTPIGLAALDHLGVAGDDRHARRARGVAHARRDALQVGERKALFDDEARREIERPRARHRDVVDGAVHGERADVAAGKEDRRDDIGVGGHHHAPGGRIERRLVVAGAQPVVVEGGVKNVLDQLAHGAPAGAVGKIDPAGLHVELAADRLLHAHATFLRCGAAFAASRKRP